MRCSIGGVFDSGSPTEPRDIRRILAGFQGGFMSLRDTACTYHPLDRQEDDMTSVIAVFQLSAVLTIAILVCICVVCSYRNSTPLQRDRRRLVVGDSSPAPNADESFTPRARGWNDHDSSRKRKDEADFILASRRF
jgi:hypothetical protein